MKRNGKSDMRGRKITVLSDDGRETYDRIFARCRKNPTQPKPEKKERIHHR
jgi:hypothetical protein